MANGPGGTPSRYNRPNGNFKSKSKKSKKGRIQKARKDKMKRRSLVQGGCY